LIIQFNNWVIAVIRSQIDKKKKKRVSTIEVKLQFSEISSNQQEQAPAFLIFLHIITSQRN
jgi:type VI protein secretion system component Hcp